MFFLGIDIGKNTHVASLLDEKAKIIFKAYSFANTLDAAEALLVKLEPYKDSLEIGMEATGHYWLSLYSFLAFNSKVKFDKCNVQNMQIAFMKKPLPKLVEIDYVGSGVFNEGTITG